MPQSRCLISLSASLVLLSVMATIAALPASQLPRAQAEAQAEAFAATPGFTRIDSTGCYDPGFTIPAKKHTNVASRDGCEQLCAADPMCNAYTWVSDKKYCYVKPSCEVRRPKATEWSGVRSAAATATQLPQLPVDSFFSTTVPAPTVPATTVPETVPATTVPATVPATVGATTVTAKGLRVDTSKLPVYESIWPAGIFRNCHAPTVYRHTNGDVYAATFAGEKEKDPGVSIIIGKRAGGRWGTAVMATVKINQTAHWNPVLFRGTGANSDKLWLHFKVGSDTRIWVTHVASLDLSSPTAKWSTPVRLENEPGQRPRGCVKNKPAVNPTTGVIVAGSSVETDTSWTVFTDTSSDGGATWTRGADVAMDSGVTMIQPAMWWDASGTTHMLARTKESNGRLYGSSSKDAGATWSKAARTAIPNNNSGVDIAALPDGRLLLAYNNKSNRDRFPLRVGVSYDNGATFPHWMDIESTTGEFSYPAIVAWGEGADAAFGLVYTWNRTNTKYVEMKMSQFYTLIGAAPPGNAAVIM